jgi:hypothetical protein
MGIIDSSDHKGILGSAQQDLGSTMWIIFHDSGHWLRGSRRNGGWDAEGHHER